MSVHDVHAKHCSYVELVNSVQQRLVQSQIETKLVQMPNGNGQKSARHYENDDQICGHSKGYGQAVATRNDRIRQRKLPMKQLRRLG